MYVMTRLLLMLSVIAILYALLLGVVMGWPATGWPLAFAAFLYASRRGYKRLTTLGSARWANAHDLRRAGMLGAASGLILGRLDARRKWLPPIRPLFSWRTRAVEACRSFWPKASRGSGELVRLSQAVHTAVFSPTGGGKGVSCVIPQLFTCPKPTVVIDFKGDLAKLTADHRRRTFGHEVVLLDPFRQVTQNPSTLNSVDFVYKDDPLALDECNDLAKALVVRSGEEKEPHWNDAAEAWIAALIATAVCHGSAADGTRSLQAVRELLQPQRLEMALKVMSESTGVWGGMLTRLGAGLGHFADREKASVLTTVTRHLRFLDTPAIAESTQKSSFDPAKLRDGKMTVYLILPPDRMRAQAGLLRMWVGSLLRAVIRGGLQEKNKVHFILDEAASLGHLESIDDAIDKYRGYGVRLQFYYQSLGQLKKCFPNGQDQTLLSNASQVFFGVNDNATADYVSARLGEQTIIVDSGGSSSGTSSQSTIGGQSSRSSSHSLSRNSNWGQQARKLLKPEEVMALPPRTAITFMPGVSPVMTTLLRYYEEKNLGRRPGWIRRACGACVHLAAAAMVCATSLAMAAALTGLLTERNSPQAPSHQRKPPIRYFDYRP